MGRLYNSNVGTFAGGWDVRISKPLDVRGYVETKADLTTLSTWTDEDGNNYVYKGMIVVTVDDGTIYVYNGETNSEADIQDETKWAVSSGGSVEGDILESNAVQKLHDEGITVMNSGDMDYVDMGTKDSDGNTIYWATMNVGATSISDPGKYYNPQAASTDVYAVSSDASTINSDFSINIEEGVWDTLPLKYDIANKVLGGDWKMATMNMFKDLVANSTYEEVTINDTLCVKFTSTINGNELVFPYGSACEEGVLIQDYLGGLCYMWMGDCANSGDSTYPYCGRVFTIMGSAITGGSLVIDAEDTYIPYLLMCYGLNIRGVIIATTSKFVLQSEQVTYTAKSPLKIEDNVISADDTLITDDNAIDKLHDVGYTDHYCTHSTSSFKYYQMYSKPETSFKADNGQVECYWESFISDLDFDAWNVIPKAFGDSEGVYINDLITSPEDYNTYANCPFCSTDTYSTSEFKTYCDNSDNKMSDLWYTGWYGNYPSRYNYSGWYLPTYFHYSDLVSNCTVTYRTKEEMSTISGYHDRDYGAAEFTSALNPEHKIYFALFGSVVDGVYDANVTYYYGRSSISKSSDVVSALKLVYDPSTNTVTASAITDYPAKYPAGIKLIADASQDEEVHFAYKEEFTATAVEVNDPAYDYNPEYLTSVTKNGTVYRVKYSTADLTTHGYGWFSDGDIVQHSGETTSTFTYGYFYKRINSSTWLRINVQPLSADEGIDLTLSVKDNKFTLSLSNSQKTVDAVYGWNPVKKAWAVTGGDSDVFDTNSITDYAAHGLSEGADISGLTAKEVLEKILFGTFAPVWTDASASLSTTSATTLAVGDTMPLLSTFTAGGSAAKAVGKTTANGGAATNDIKITTTGVSDGDTINSRKQVVVSLTRTYAKGTENVVDSKGGNTNKTATVAKTNIDSASVNSNIVVDVEDTTTPANTTYVIDAIEKTATVTISFAAPIYIDGVAQDLSYNGTEYKKSLGKIQKGSGTHYFEVPNTYTGVLIQYVNPTDATKWVDLTDSITEEDNSRTLGDVTYKKYIFGETTGETTYRLTFKIA